MGASPPAKAPSGDDMQMMDDHTTYTQTRQSIEVPDEQNSGRLEHREHPNVPVTQDENDEIHHQAEHFSTPASDCSNSTGIDAATDEDTLRACTAASSHVQESSLQTAGALPTVLGNSAQSRGEGSEFAYSKTKKQDFNFHRTRNGPAAMLTETNQAGSKAVSVGHTQQSHASPPAGETPSMDDNEIAVPPSDGAVHHQRKRKKRHGWRSATAATGVERFETAPTQQTDDIATGESSAQQTIVESRDVSNGNHADAAETFEDARENIDPAPQEPCQEQKHFDGSMHDAQEDEELEPLAIKDLQFGGHFRKSTEVPERARLATPDQPIDEHMQYEHGTSSPNTQLQEDLQAAAWQQQPFDGVFDLADPVPHAPEFNQLVGHEPHQPADANVELDDGEYQQQIPSQDQSQRVRSVEPEYSAPRPVKRKKSKKIRRATVPAPAELPPSDPASSDLNDYLSIMSYKWNEKRQATKAKFSRERDALHAQMQQLLDEKEAMQEDLSAAHGQLHILYSSDEKQKAKIAAYEARVDKFKIFIEGLGNDVDALKKDASAARRRSETLSANAEDRMSQQNNLHQELSECANRAIELKDEAIKACHELQSDLQAAGLRSEYLEQQLNERIGMLAEERDRSSRLEMQLSNATGGVDKILHAIKQSSEQTLDKLFELHADIEVRDKTKETTEMIEKTMSTVRQLNCEESDHSNDIESIKGLVEGFSKNVECLLEKAEDASAQDKAANSIETLLSDALKDLRAELAQREKQAQAATAQREEIAVLQEKLTANEVQLQVTSNQLAAAQVREQELQKQRTILQVKVEHLESRPEPDENQIRDLRTELASQHEALNAAKDNLVQRVEECSVLKESNAKLQEQLQTRQLRENDHDHAVDFQVERDQLSRQFEIKLQKLREELAKESVKTQMAEKSKMENTVKRIQAQYDNAQKQLQPLRLENAELRAKHAEMTQEISELSQAKAKVSEELQRQLRATTNEIEGLKATIKELQSQAQESIGLQEQCKELATQFATGQMKAEGVAQENAVLAKQLDEVQKALHCAQAGKSDVESALDRLSTENAAALQELAEKVKGAEVNAEQAEQGLQRYQATSQQSLEEERARFEKHLQALHEEIAGLRNQLTEGEAKQKAYVVEVSKSWEQEVKDHEQRLKDAAGKTEDADRQRDEARAEVARLREQLEQVMATRSASMPPPPPGPLSDRFQSSQQPHNASSPSGQVTPTVSDKENEPPRPMRKKVDRKNNAVIEYGPIPVPDALRPDSYGRGPVVEESQFKQGLSRPKQAASRSRAPWAEIRRDSEDDLLDTASRISSHPPEVVDETQLIDETLASPNHNNTIGSWHPPTLQHMSSALSVHSTINPTVLQGPRMPSQDNSEVQRTTSQPPPNFNIFEDDTALAIAAIETHLPGTMVWNEKKATETFAFQKAHPNPNMSVKRRPSESGDGQEARHLQSGMYRPMVRENTESSINPAARRPLAAHSSSPDFVSGPLSARKLNTYHALGNSSGGTKRGTSRNYTMPTADPRLAHREPATAGPAKRKAESNAVETYESERKKRMAARSGRAANEPTGYVLRTNTQPQSKPSIYDVPSSSSLSSGAQAGSHTQSRSHNSSARVRTLAGQVPRGLKGGKKMSRDNPMGARFIAELKK